MSYALFTQPQPADRYRGQRDPLLQLEKLNVSFDGFRALTDLSLQIGVGELHCIIGLNGAGKTTLMNVITGKTRPDKGRVPYDQNSDLLNFELYLGAARRIDALGDQHFPRHHRFVVFQRLLVNAQSMQPYKQGRQQQQRGEKSQSLPNF
ncbi:ATP-binding cassette domain-containing protein [Candidatus Pantoea persica]|uniref:ATP-binding cassette domain-containing protein n=1 Tax=Candidatus Pantoea persica TaxID=2518128 RepID=UPI00215D7AA2|nr:ATP-binding cassette domain-containing protein [Candidatus Pantoea persica]MBA2815840.1 Deoxyribose operon repressor [Candidatus Pantoea persica]